MTSAHRFDVKLTGNSYGVRLRRTDLKRIDPEDFVFLGDFFAILSEWA